MHKKIPTLFSKNNKPSNSSLKVSPPNAFFMFPFMEIPRTLHVIKIIPSRKNPNIPLGSSTEHSPNAPIPKVVTSPGSKPISHNSLLFQKNICSFLLGIPSSSFFCPTANSDYLTLSLNIQP